MDLNVKDENGVDEKNEARRSPNKKEIDVKKKQMTLNLDSSKSASRKRAVIGNNGLGNANSITSILDPQSMSGFWNSPFSKVILESPDVQMLKMPTPDVEKFILASNLNSTPTPSLANRKFLETMKQLSELNSEPFNSQNNNSNSDSSRPPSNASNSDNNPYLQDDNSNATSLISGNNSNCSFNTSNNSANNQSFNENADLEAIGMLKNQDLSKLERKRLRNRIAASKCRKRKLERISNLEDRVKKLKDENQALYGEVMKLRDKNNRLKSEVCSHKKNGCNIDLSNISIRD